MAIENKIDLDLIEFDWNLKSVMIKNHPQLAYDLFKLNNKNKPKNLRDSLKLICNNPNFYNKKDLTNMF